MTFEIKNFLLYFSWKSYKKYLQKKIKCLRKLFERYQIYI